MDLVGRIAKMEKKGNAVRFVKVVKFREAARDKIKIKTILVVRHK